MKTLASTDIARISDSSEIEFGEQQRESTLCVFSKEILDVHDLAEIFKCSREKIKRMARRRDLPAFKFGKHWYVRLEDLERFLANQVESGSHLRRDQENRE
jgi:excisionase family DNA binding protein